MGQGDEVRNPTPEVVYKIKLKCSIPVFGLCIDVGHVQRLGLDPV